MTSPYTGTVATPDREDSETTDFPRTSLATSDEATARSAEPRREIRTPAPAPAPVPQPAYASAGLAPQPQYQVITQPQKGSRTETLAMALIALIVAAAAGLGSFALAKSTAPTEAEVAAYQRIAAGEGELAGRVNGYQLGHQQGVIENRQIARYQGLIAQARQFNKGWKVGMKDGKNMYRYRGGYRSGGYGYGGYYGGGQVSSALMSAQAIANSTGYPVDVEIY